MPNDPVTLSSWRGRRVLAAAATVLALAMKNTHQACYLTS